MDHRTGDEKIKLEELLQIEVTTSDRAKYRIEGNKTDEYIEKE